MCGRFLWGHERISLILAAPAIFPGTRSPPGLLFKCLISLEQNFDPGIVPLLLISISSALKGVGIYSNKKLQQLVIKQPTQLVRCLVL